jgi:type IV pilus assembly protein PilN
MLKINLLPSQRRAESAGTDNGRIFIAAMAGVSIVVVSGLLFYHSGVLKDVKDAHDRNVTEDARIRSIRSRVADHDHIRSELAEIHAREDAISHLEGARTGPTSMLVELSHLLSPGGRPFSDPLVLERVQRDNPTEMFNGTWDPHRLWITEFTEQHREVEIEGSGRTPDDVGEFMRRMMLSQYFEQVRLERSEGAEDHDTKISVQNYKIAARVRY